MENGKNIFLRAGFPEESVKVVIRDREMGIARDILKEAKDGHSCLIMGRKGMSKLRDLILGSISIKLIQKVSFVPLIVVGKTSHPERILMALDCSDNAMRIVDYVGSTVCDSGAELFLIHVIRSNEQKIIEKAMKDIDNVFEIVKIKLIKSGFAKNQITTKIITKAHSRAGAILQEAKEGGCGTILVGRRGLSEVKDFDVGRVSNKVLHMAKKHAVWVVS